MCRSDFHSLRDIPLQPVAPQIVDDEHDGGDGPGQRIAESNGGEIPVQGNDDQNPDHTQYTDAETGQQHGNDGIPAASGGSAQDFDADIGDVGWRNHMDDGHTDIHYPRITGEQSQENTSSCHDDDAQQHAGESGHAHTDPHTFPNAVIFARTEVLSGEGGDGNAVGAHDHPEHAVHLAVGRPGGDGIGPEGVDAGLDDQVGDGIHGGLQARRQADADDGGQDAGGKTDLPRVQLVHVIGLHQRIDHHSRTGKLGQGSCDGDARYAQLQNHHKKQVQYDVGQGGSDQVIQRAFGVPDGAQDAGPHVIDQGRDHAEKIDSHIDERQPHDILRCVHGAQRHSCEDDAQRHDDGTACDGQSDGGMYCLAHVVLMLRTVELGNDHGGAGGKAGKKADQKVDQGGGGAAYRSERLFSHKISHHHSIRRIVQLLKKGAKQYGKKEDQELFPDNSFCDLIDIHSFSGSHLEACLSVSQ